jgi:MbtH protein
VWLDVPKNYKGQIMDTNDQLDALTYMVVINQEEQYSIWPADRDAPLGWKDVGKHGTKDECLGYIRDVWDDMRPASLRKQLEEQS